MASWTPIWGQAHAALSYFSFPEKPQTFRLILSPAISGTHLRVRLSNFFGKDSVFIGGISAAVCDADGNLLSDSVDLTGAFRLQRKTRFISPAVSFPVQPGAHLCVSVYVKAGRLTCGNLMNNAGLCVMPGDHRHVIFAGHTVRTNDRLRHAVSGLLRMPFHQPIPLFDAVEVLNADGAKAIVVFGDSLSQQGFWVNPFESRVRVAFPGRYSVVNKSITGNRVLQDCSPIFFARNLFGVKGLTRLADDVLAYDNIGFVILELGINDLLQYATINGLPKEKPTAAALVDGIFTLTWQMQNAGIRVIGTTPIGFGDCMDATPEKLALLEDVLAMLRLRQNEFDGFFDMAAVTSDPDRPLHTRRTYLGGDKLHFNAAGGKAVADSFDLSLLNIE